MRAFPCAELLNRHVSLFIPRHLDYNNLHYVPSVTHDKQRLSAVRYLLVSQISPFHLSTSFWAHATGLGTMICGRSLGPAKPGRIEVATFCPTMLAVRGKTRQYCFSLHGCTNDSKGFSHTFPVVRGKTSQNLGNIIALAMLPPQCVLVLLGPRSLARMLFDEKTLVIQASSFTDIFVSLFFLFLCSMLGFVCLLACLLVCLFVC